MYLLSINKLCTGNLCRPGRKHDVKAQVHNGRRRRLSRSGCQKLIARSATRVDIKRLVVGSLIRSFVQRRARGFCMHPRRRKDYQRSKTNTVKERKQSLGSARSGCLSFIVFCFPWCNRLSKTKSKPGGLSRACRVVCNLLGTKRSYCWEVWSEIGFRRLSGHEKCSKMKVPRIRRNQHHCVRLVFLIPVV